jgi:hypothetical protein
MESLALAMTVRQSVTKYTVQDFARLLFVNIVAE